MPRGDHVRAGRAARRWLRWLAGPPGEDRSMPGVELPVVALTILGILLVLLGLFAAGSVEPIALGMGAIAVAGVLAVVGSRRGA